MVERNANLEALVDADLDALAAALSVRTVDLLKAGAGLVPAWPVGIQPRVSDAEMVTLAVFACCWGSIAGTLGPLCPRSPGAPVPLPAPTPVECARSRETERCSDLAGWAEFAYCASHSRFY